MFGGSYKNIVSPKTRTNPQIKTTIDFFLGSYKNNVFANTAIDRPIPNNPKKIYTNLRGTVRNFTVRCMGIIARLKNEANSANVLEDQPFERSWRTAVPILHFDGV